VYELQLTSGMISERAVSGGERGLVAAKGLWAALSACAPHESGGDVVVFTRSVHN